MKRVRLQGRASLSQLGAVGQPINLRPWIPFCQRCQSIRKSSTQTIGGQSVEGITGLVELEAIASPRVSPYKPRPKPFPDAGLNNAKLAALHARLQLSKDFPARALAQALVDPTADPQPERNNAALAALGEDLLGYYCAEHIICKYPRLPVEVLWAVQAAYVGAHTLCALTKEWGVEPVVAPGQGVNPGYLQFREAMRKEAHYQPGYHAALKQSIEAVDLLPIDWKTKRERQAAPPGWTSQQSRERITFTYRIMKGDQFGQEPLKPTINEEGQLITTLDQASANFVRALFAAIHLHLGPAAAKSFFQSHFTSRFLDVTEMLKFERPQRDLMLLCNREGFEAPVARMISETGRKSTHPVFVVGIFSGRDKLGEGIGGSLMEAKARASVATLKAWYLYSPLDVTVPSETTIPTTQRKWKPNVVDHGEIIS